MLIAVGLTNSELTELGHRRLVVLCQANSLLVERKLERGAAHSQSSEPIQVLAHLRPFDRLEFSAIKNILRVNGPNNINKVSSYSLELSGASVEGQFLLTNLIRQHGGGQAVPQYTGVLQFFAQDGFVRVNLICTLEEYVKGVLQSEVPESYHLEAIKAQAIAARTYALNPRIDHTSDRCNVCDSYLCCQYFGGSNPKLAGKYVDAINNTKNQILVWQDKPILALFSACAGGHTENYESCFSDLGTNKFPGTPIPYLKGVPEGRLPIQGEGRISEKLLRELWQMKDLTTCDSWSNQFRWQLVLPADALEAEMHQVVQTMINSSEFAPFMVAPAGGKFGHINEFRVTERGFSGTAMSLEITTSTGIWRVDKELVIRSIFKNKELKLNRLKSAKFILEHESDRLGLLANLRLRGMGAGHGVGMQQTGAQGLALAGLSYRRILSHYYSGAQVANV